MIRSLVEEAIPEDGVEGCIGIVQLQRGGFEQAVRYVRRGLGEGHPPGVELAVPHNNGGRIAGWSVEMCAGTRREKPFRKTKGGLRLRRNGSRRDSDRGTRSRRPVSAGLFLNVVIASEPEEVRRRTFGKQVGARGKQQGRGPRRSERSDRCPGLNGELVGNR